MLNMGWEAGADNLIYLNYMEEQERPKTSDTSPVFDSENFTNLGNENNHGEQK